MNSIYAAACSLDGDVLRLVFIGEDTPEAAQTALFRVSPKFGKKHGRRRVDPDHHSARTGWACRRIAPWSR